jgi:hypothetical protein
MLINPVRFRKINRGILFETSHRIRDRKSRRDAHQFKVALAVIAAIFANEYFFALTVHTPAGVFARLLRDAGVKLDDHLIGDKLWTTALPRAAPLRGALDGEKGEASGERTNRYQRST